jgi:hypothetical protein
VTAVYVGELSIGAAVPGASAAAQAGASGINAAFPDLQARVDALTAEIAALATMPPLPTFIEMAARADALVASIALAVATPGLPPPPSIATAIVQLQALVTSLLAMVGSLNAQLTGIVSFQALLAADSVHVVATDGAVANLGADIQSAVGPVGSGHANALALITTNAATWTAMSAVFKVTP